MKKSKHSKAVDRALKNFKPSETWKTVTSKVKYVHEMRDNRGFLDSDFPTMKKRGKIK